MLVATVMRAVPATKDSVLRADLCDGSFTGLWPPRTPTQMHPARCSLARPNIGTAVPGSPTGR